MKDDKYVEEKAKELRQEFKDGSLSVLSFCEYFIRTIVEDMDDEYWAQEEYYLDTIKELKKGKPKVSREFVKAHWERMHFSNNLLRDIEKILKEAGVEVSDE